MSQIQELKTYKILLEFNDDDEFLSARKRSKKFTELFLKEIEENKYVIAVDAIEGTTLYNSDGKYLSFHPRNK